MSSSFDNLIIRHFRRVVSRLEVWIFTRKGFIKETGRSQGHVQKGHQVFLYINCCGISWPTFSYSINFFNYEDSRNTEEDPDEGDIQMEYFCD